MKKKNSGFTLLEMIMAMIILAIITVGLAPLIKTSMLSFVQTSVISESGQAARIAFNRLLLDMKKMNIINSGSASAISFNDIDGNTTAYTVSGGNLLRNGSIAAADVSGLTFEYVDVIGTAYSTPSDTTWQIKVTLDFDIQGDNASYTAEVSPRNINFSKDAM